MLVEISRMTKEDIPGAIECIQTGFADDPYFTWMFDGSKFSKARNDVSLTNRFLWGIKNALFYVAREVPSDCEIPEQKGRQEPHEQTSLLRDKSSSSGPARVVGVAMWLLPQPRSKPDSWFTYFQTWLLSFRQLLTNIRFMGRGGLLVHRYKIWKTAQAKVQDELWTDERGYYFCNELAVRPEFHGKGIGRQLVTVVTQQADEEGMRCYLESSKQVPNIQIYERFGFRLIRDMVCDDNGETCKLYCMTREPKSQS
ncbi:acetyltransferase [Nannizzia gypsea CBS 118893]|uniref:Acetyltransferase n=1 Tax=Arthroderma gypseum (strain ATCC MYA-4604 / CBS 118893) TaxID=535722 RepID=E4UN30_ARTGP|nr:acetyltransferase [Nannizzia gypsea CBS 118893]EFR00332.1 acetyltransferase [Nannizzia gypsea CBS 118893]